MDLNNLNQVGLSKGEISVYQAVLELGNTTLNNIQEKTGIERRNIYDILNKLIEKGLISYIIESKRKTYSITHPNKLQEEIENKEKKLLELKKQIPSITDLYKINSPQIKAEVFRGNESIKALFNESLNYEKIYFIGGNSFQDYTVSKSLILWFEAWMKKRVELKVKMYDLVDYGTHLKGLTPENKEKQEKNLYYYKQLPKDLQSPMVIFMFRNKVAQILWSKQPFAFVLESKEIKESFMKYFNYFWN